MKEKTVKVKHENTRFGLQSMSKHGFQNEDYEIKFRSGTACTFIIKQDALDRLGLKLNHQGWLSKH